jgi:hypothetical protein
MLHPEHIDNFIDSGKALVEGKIAELAAFRVTPHWDDLRAVVDGLLQHIATWEPPPKEAPPMETPTVANDQPAMAPADEAPQPAPSVAPEQPPTEAN